MEVLTEVTALECRILRLQADHEVAAVAAGREAERVAVQTLQTAGQHLALVEQELAETQQLLNQQQEALTALHTDEKTTDRGLRREFANAGADALSRLIQLYKTRLVPAAAEAAASTGASAFLAGKSSSMSGSQAVHSSNTAGLSAFKQEFVPLSYSLDNASSSTAGTGAAAAAAAGSGASSSGLGGGNDLRGPLGPAAVGVAPLSDAQRPDGVDHGLWERFVEYRAARGQLDITVREQTAKVLSLKRQQELLQSRQADLVRQVQAAGEALDALRTQRAAATYDVELQLRLKQGQVECWPIGVSGSAPDALLVSRDQVSGLNAVILNKGAAKLDLMRQMKEFKRGIYQLQWEEKKCEMEVRYPVHRRCMLLCNHDLRLFLHIWLQSEHLPC
eukprot:GHRR01030945.1.p1 GENE.GHRR01030945.1~~GHRR01030945.1.p1  ORF type:complete len:391 (+),score=167.35 GHRR01030945.1:894-2066(+)